VIHNRLTHSLEVAQIARRLSEKLSSGVEAERVLTLTGPINPDVAEAAALAHDLGHPPFGHIAENQLDVLARKKGLLDGFNGNAQSFRIVTKLSVRDEEFPGLNLSAASLRAILKYPWYRHTDGGKKQEKWGAYHSESEDFEFATSLGNPSDSLRSIEAEIMDWADDIAYAVHDVEDFYRADLVPLYRLKTDSKERNNFLQSRLPVAAKQANCSESDLGAQFENWITECPIDEQFDGRKRQRGALRKLTSTSIQNYLFAFDVVSNGDIGWRVEIGSEAKMEVALLKQLTWHYVIDRAGVAAQQLGQRRLISHLFQQFSNAAIKGRSKEILPPKCRELLTSEITPEERVRIVIDLIASMTESQAFQVNAMLSGTSRAHFYDPYVT